MASSTKSRGESSGQKDETKGERLDRELIELLNELRVALPGVQVLFAFLLTVPFTTRFSDLSTLQRNTYFFAFIATAVATALLMAPTAHHRLRWRQWDKERLLRVSNRLTIAGLAAVVLAMAASTFVISDLLFGIRSAAWIAAALVVGFVGLWFGVPLLRALRDRNG